MKSTKTSQEKLKGSENQGQKFGLARSDTAGRTLFAVPRLRSWSGTVCLIAAPPLTRIDRDALGISSCSSILFYAQKFLGKKLLKDFLINITNP